MRSILAELMREHGACPHVDNPEKPSLLYGIIPEELEKLANDWGNNSKDAIGRKLRADAPVMIAGVISIPEDANDNWDSYKKLSVKWLKHTYGERLRTVVEHTDESHKHLHYYVVPKPGESMDDIHVGKRASKKAKLAGEVKGAQNLAYIEGMRKMQDKFYMGVSARFGLTRFGPGKRRQTRKEWRLEQHTSAITAKLLNSGKAAFKKGYDKGFTLGTEEGIKTASSAGRQVGAFFASSVKMLADAVYSPKLEAQKIAEDEVKAAKEKTQRANARTLRVEAEAQAALRLANEEIDKLKRTVSNLEKENKHLAANQSGYTVTLSEKKNLTI